MLYETQKATAADARKAHVRQALLNGPILRTLFKLGWPTIVVLVVQTLVGVAETYWVSFLGTAALAGVTLVFPISMLMTMMSNGGIGGGVASAVARAIGAGRRHDADALWGFGLPTLFALVAAAIVISAAISFVATLSGAIWRTGPE